MTVPAAQYLRVSTEEQRYSLQNQVDAIREYATEHGFEIVETYSDAGRSGLQLHHRPGLIRLLGDVVGGDSVFRAVLVYDVSRWGRFQDCDEAAHYEFICKSAGAPVHYCAENFNNDTSLPSSIVKALKRSMAAEFSRELGTRVFTGAKNIVELGFKAGGKPGYGLRRFMISANGEPRRILEKHEMKHLRTDRVIFVPGPKEEVEWVREMFRLVVEENKTPTYITAQLNSQNVKGPSRNGIWRIGHVCRILRDPKYAGHNVWNRTSVRLGQRRVARPRAEWFVKENAFAPLIDPRTFEQVQQVLEEQSRPYSKDELLEMLRGCLKQQGNLSFSVVKSCPDLPSVNTFIKRFGTLRNAFELAGRRPASSFAIDELREQVGRMRHDLLRQIVSTFPTQVKTVFLDQSESEYLRLDGTFSIAVIVCPVVRRSGQLTWIADSRAIDRKTMTFLARLDPPDNNTFRDFYLLPAPGRHWIRHRGQLNKGTQLSSLEEFCSAARAIADAG